MCLAEALLRIPDPETAERLIRDKLSKGRWDAHLGHSRSLLVNASAWGLPSHWQRPRQARPVIDDAACQCLLEHCSRMDREGKRIAALDSPAGPGFWFGPRIYEIERLEQLAGEVFGSVLHVMGCGPADPRSQPAALRSA